MLRTHAITVGLAVALLCLASTVVFAQEDTPVSRGVVATITALDAPTGMAALQTAAGEVFELPKSQLWKVGDTVLCDQREGLPPRLQRCQLWQVKAAGDAVARGGGSQGPRTGPPPSRAEAPSTREGDVRFLATPSPADECQKLRKSVVNLEREMAGIADAASQRYSAVMAELTTARQGLASCEAKGQ